ncbi:DUF6676 family protein [Corynebacterium sp. YSMAA1_1_F7]|uniref:Rv1476 family membrane protein n=1 Tax=Corynebacterium sp. YSMAA1_1_F7 TaxID=3383590 RepID=UPI0038D095C6
MVDTSAPAPTDDVAQLIASLKDAPVFVAKGFPTAVEHGPAGLSESLTSIAEAASRGDSASEIGNLKIGYITRDGAMHNSLRDVAQKVLDGTDADTVILKSPNHAAVVSENLSRYAIESNTKILYGANSHPEATQEFLDQAAGYEAPTGLANVGVFLALAIAAVITSLSKLREKKN